MRNVRTAKALLLIIVFLLLVSLLSGCTALVSDSVADTVEKEDAAADNDISETDVSENYEEVAAESFGIVPFDEIVYVRPDIEEVCMEISANTSAVAGLKSSSEALDLAKETDEIADNFSLMYIYSRVQCSLDQSDEYWYEEYNRMRVSEPKMRAEYDKFRLTLSESDFSEEIEPDLDYGYFEGLDVLTKEQVNIIKMLNSQILQLTNEYNNILTLGTVSYDGREYSIADIYDSDDFSEDIFMAFYDKYNPELGELYIKIVRLRNEMAHEYGYNNYVDMYFDKNFASSQITLDMLQKYLDGIVEHVVPVYQKLVKEKDTYNPDIKIAYDAFNSTFSNILLQLDPELSSAYSDIKNNGYMKTERSESKERGAYSTYFPKVNMPLLFANYDEGKSFEDVIHEFGHCYDMYMTDNEYPSSADTHEIFSQGLSVIVSNHFSEFMNARDAYETQFDFLFDSFISFVFQPYYTAMEIDVYSLSDEELSLDKVNDIAYEKAKEFGLCKSGNDFAKYYYSHEWVRINHLVGSPFYTSAYATSGYIVLQLFELSRSDEALAVSKFNRMVSREGGIGFVDIITDAGFDSPFSDGATEKIAEFGKRYLLDEDF